MKPVLVEWRDACSSQGWQNPKLGNFDLLRVHTVGWLIQEDDEKIVVALNRCSNGAVGDTVSIPKPWVGKITRFKCRVPELRN